MRRMAGFTLIALGFVVSMMNAYVLALQKDGKSQVLTRIYRASISSNTVQLLVFSAESHFLDWPLLLLPKYSGNVDSAHPLKGVDI